MKEQVSANRSTINRLRCIAAFALFYATFALAQPKTELTGLQVKLTGHSEAIYATAITPDGKYLITGSFDNTIKLWDSATGKELRVFAGPQGHKSLVLNVAVSSDGSTLASGGSDNFLKVWDIPLNTHLKEYVQTAGVNAVTISSDGKMIAAACQDGTIQVLNPADGKSLFKLTGHPGGATSVSFSANGQVLVSTGVDQMVRFWNPANGQSLGSYGAHSKPALSVFHAPATPTVYSIGEDGMLKFWQVPPTASRSLPAHADAVLSMAMSPDGATVATSSSDKTVRVSNIANGQQVRQFPATTSPVQAVAIAPNNAIVGGGTIDGQLTLWNNIDGKLTSQLFAHGGGVTGVTFQAQSQQALTVGADGMMRGWTLPTTGTKSLPHPDRVLTTTLVPDGKRALTTSADKIVRLWNLASNTAERQFSGHTAAVNAVVHSPDVTSLISAGADETIRFWYITNGQQFGMLTGHSGPITSLALAPAGNLLVSTGEDGTVKFWQIPLVPSKSFVHPDAVTSVMQSPDGARLFTVCNDKQIRRWPMANPAPDKTFTAGGQVITAFTIASDGTTLAFATADKSLSIWAGDKEIKKLTNLPAVVQSLSFNAARNTLAAGFGDNSIRTYSAIDGKDLKTFTGHSGPITHLAFTPKDDLLISASADKSVRLWNPADATAKGKLDHPASVTSFCLSRDGTKLGVCGDKSVTIWTLADSKQIGNVTLPAVGASLDFNVDASRVAVACGDNKVRLYGLDGKVLETILHDGPVTSVRLHADGKQFLSASSDKSVRAWTPALLGQASHTGPVRKALFAPQGDRVFTVGDDKNLRIWDVKTFKEQKSMVVHDGPVTDFALSADLTKVATTGADKTAKVWTLADGKAIATVLLANPASALGFTPNGTRLAVAFTEGTTQQLKIFDATTGKELQRLPTPAAPVRSLVFAADQRTLFASGDDKTTSIHDVPVQFAFPVHEGGATAVAYHNVANQVFTSGKDKTVKLWDIPTQKVVRTFGPVNDPINTFALSKDFLHVAAAVGKTVKIWNIADGKELATLDHPAEVVSLNYNQDKTRLVTGTTDNLARVWDLASNRELQSFSHGAAVRGVAFNATPTTITTASADKTVMVHTLNIIRGVPASTLPLRSMAPHPNASPIITCGDDKLAKAWNTASGAEERKFEGAEGPLHAVAIAKNGQLVATGGTEKIVRIYNFNDGKIIGSFPTPAPIRNLAFHPNNLLLTVGLEDKSIVTYNVNLTLNQPLPPEFGKSLQTFQHNAVPTSLFYSADGALWSSSQDKSLRNWKVAREGPFISQQHPNLVDCVAFDKTNTLVATGCHDGVLRIYDLPKNAVQKSINAHTQPMSSTIYCVAFTPDGKQVVTGSYDRSLKLWDVASGNMVREFKPFTEKMFEKGHRDQVFCVAFTSDGQFMASGSSDKSIKLWKVADGTVVREFSNPAWKALAPNEAAPAHPGWIYGLRFSPDDKQLISVGAAPKNRGYMAAWNVADGKMLFGSELPTGPIYSMSLNKEGTSILIGCGPMNRQDGTSEAYLLKTPK